jgi:hypothetical protein
MEKDMKLRKFIAIAIRKYLNEQNELLLAPNGNKSNLTPELYKLVRTPEFKSWFGDWENSNNSSKVVDENGEPLVVYHRTDSDFEEFDNTKGIRKNGFVGGNFFYFSDDRYGYSNYGHREIAAFINLRNPTYKVNVDGEYIKSSNDGAILNFDRFGEKEKIIIATKPNQIKSIKNTKFSNSNNIFS